MTIEKFLQKQECELRLQGRIDGARASQLEQAILELANDTEIHSLYLNLAEANFLCSSGIRVVVQHHRQWKAQRRLLIISRTSPEVDQILELTGLREMIVEKI